MVRVGVFGLWLRPDFLDGWLFGWKEWSRSARDAWFVVVLDGSCEVALPLGKVVKTCTDGIELRESAGDSGERFFNDSVACAWCGSVMVQSGESR